MTIREKAEQEGLDVSQVANIAADVGIEFTDVDRKLNAAEAIRLGKSVKSFKGSSGIGGDAESSSVLFWSTNINYLIGRGIVDRETAISIKKHVLRLDAKEDAKLIDNIRRLMLTDVYEVFEEPFEEESKEYYEFEALLDGLLFTGPTNTASRMGLKTVRALFTSGELAVMEDNGFNAKRLKTKALRTKSVVCLANNGIN